MNRAWVRKTRRHDLSRKACRDKRQRPGGHWSNRCGSISRARDGRQVLCCKQPLHTRFIVAPVAECSVAFENLIGSLAGSRQQDEHTSDSTHLLEHVTSVSDPVQSIWRTKAPIKVLVQTGRDRG